MKQMAIVLLLSAGLVTFVRLMPKPHAVVQACADDDGDDGDDGDGGDDGNS